jgi:hypothetical protein
MIVSVCMSWCVFRGACLCWQRVFRVHRFRVAMHRRVVLRIESTRHLHDAAITLQHNIKRVRPTPYMPFSLVDGTWESVLSLISMRTDWV